MKTKFKKDITILRKTRRMNSQFRVYVENGRYFISELGADDFRRVIVSKAEAEKHAAILNDNHFAQSCRMEIDQAHRLGSTSFYRVKHTFRQGQGFRNGQLQGA
jgi:hypothetical protein